MVVDNFELNSEKEGFKKSDSAYVQPSIKASNSLHTLVGDGVKKVNLLVETCDNYAVQERQPNFLGALMSITILPATLVYAVMLWNQLKENPYVEGNNMLWSMSYSPFPVDLECASETGCLLSYMTASGHSECKSLDKGQRGKYQMYYSGGRTPMISIYTAKNSSEVANIYSEANSWDKQPPTNKNGVFVMPAPVYASSLLVNYVKTKNNTLSGLGRLRHEWFFTHINSSPDPEEFAADPCVTSMTDAHPAGVDHTKIRMAPSFNEIEVNDSFSFLDYIGTTSGMYGLFISAGAIILSVMELELWTRAFAQKTIADFQTGNRVHDDDGIKEIA